MGGVPFAAVRLASEEIVDRLAPLEGDEESFAERFALIVSRDGPIVYGNPFEEK